MRPRLAASLLVPFLLARPLQAAPPEAPSEWEGGTDGVRVELPGGVTLSLAPGARARAAQRPIDLALGGARKTRTHVIDVLAGRVEGEAPPPTRGRRTGLLLRTTEALGVVTEGGRVVATRDDTLGAVASQGGVAWAGSSAGYRPLSPGLLIDSTGASRALPPAPVANAAVHAFLGLRSAPRVSRLDWTPVAGAARYVVTVASTDRPEPLEVLETTGTSLPRPLAPLPPGRYVARVAGVDASGIPGAPSAPVDLRVVTVGPLPGCFVAPDGAVHVREGARVPLLHAGGLRLRHGTAGDTEAPAELAPLRSAPTTYSLFDPRDGAALELLVVPLRAEVSVAVGPKRVRWPGEAIDVRVSLLDRGGRPLPQGVEVVPSVHLGVDPLAVDFEREGSGLRARVEAPADAGPGPWVLRVEARDQYGALLGRDFVEIARHDEPAGTPLPRAGSPVALAR